MSHCEPASCTNSLPTMNAANLCNKCGKRKCYIQPPRAKSCRPQQYLTYPAERMDGRTVYKESFQCVDSNTVKYCRSEPFRPLCTLRPNPEKLAKETVTKMSFPVYCNVERRKPIVPNPPSLLGEGPMQTLTTQKHDFVCKVIPPRPLIRPVEHFPKVSAPIDKCTTQKLSFMPPCGFDRAKSFKPVMTYQPPEFPMETETVHRLSFIPYCPPPKEKLPWAERPKYCRPTQPMDTITTQKLSYMPPGCFVRDDCCCCCSMESNDQSFSVAPRAAVC